MREYLSSKEKKKKKNIGVKNMENSNVEYKVGSSLDDRER